MARGRTSIPRPEGRDRRLVAERPPLPLDRHRQRRVARHLGLLGCSARSMRKEGLEPPRPLGHTLLRRARLPFRHFRVDGASLPHAAAPPRPRTPPRAILLCCRHGPQPPPQVEERQDDQNHGPRAASAAGFTPAKRAGGPGGAAQDPPGRKKEVFPLESRLRRGIAGQEGAHLRDRARARPAGDRHPRPGDRPQGEAAGLPAGQGAGRGRQAPLQGRDPRRGGRGHREQGGVRRAGRPRPEAPRPARRSRR